MADIIPHGGYCCGINHAYGFNEGYGEGDKKVTESAIAYRLARGMLVEIVLTDDQINPDHDQWDGGDGKRVRDTLRKFGFKKVTRFLNGNSGNYCNVYHAHRNRESLVRGRTS